MTEPTKNEPAFPIVHPPVEGITCGGVEHYGLSLRDYFAAKAMQAHMVGRGAMVAAITKAIKDHGPMTVPGIAAVLGIKPQAMWTVISNMNTAGIRIPKRIYVSDWRQTGGDRSRTTWPVYALGALADKPRPGVLAGDVLRLRVNSVFALGDYCAGLSA